MQLELEQRHAPVSLSGETIVGYAIVFNSPSQDLGGFVEVIESQAVDRTFREGLDVRALVDHDRAKVLGRTTAGTLILQKDTRGLRVEIHPPQTTVGRDILESVRRGDITGMSFTFGVMRPDGERFEQRAGITTRYISDMRIPEVSIVSFPAYEATDVSVAQRSLQAFQAANTTHASLLDALRRRHRVRAWR